MKIINFFQTNYVNKNVDESSENIYLNIKNKKKVVGSNTFVNCLCNSSLWRHYDCNSNLI